MDARSSSRFSCDNRHDAGFAALASRDFDAVITRTPAPTSKRSSSHHGKKRLRRI
jgi:hypothetical protein